MAGARRPGSVADAVAALGERNLLRGEHPDADEAEQLPPAGPPPAHEVSQAPGEPDALPEEPDASPEPQGSPAVSVPAPAAQPPRTAGAPARRSRRPAEPDINTNVALPASVKDEMKSLTRPHRTGQDRVLGAHWLARAYVLAVHEIVGGSLDLYGVGADDGAEAVARVRAALTARIAPREKRPPAADVSEPPEALAAA